MTRLVHELRPAGRDPVRALEYALNVTKFVQIPISVQKAVLIEFECTLTVTKEHDIMPSVVGSPRREVEYISNV